MKKTIATISVNLLCLVAACSFFFHLGTEYQEKRIIEAMHPDYTTWSSTMLSHAVEGHQEEIANLESELKYIVGLQKIKLLEEGILWLDEYGNYHDKEGNIVVWN